MRDQAGSLVFDLIITHDRYGSSSHVQQNGLLSHPQDLDGLSARLAMCGDTALHGFGSRLILF